MKARTYITAMLIPALVGTLTINAQSVQRSNDKENNSGRQVHNTLPNAQNADKYNRRTENPGEARGHQIQAKINNPGGHIVQNQSYKDPKHMSISNTINPRSDYRKPEGVVRKSETNYGSNDMHKHYEKPYYSGKHYHNVYPGSHIKAHYHYDAYRNNYRVLYYPAHHNIYWTRGMYREYVRLYPNYNHWHYRFGYSIQTISTFEAKFNLGEVARVYGRVYATWYNRETDDFLLFFGGDFPAQEFTLVVPGKIARKFNRRPEIYFPGRHLTATGLITSYEGTPEMVVRQNSQISLY